MHKITGFVRGVDIGTIILRDINIGIFVQQFPDEQKIKRNGVQCGQ
jgi:hypothetical protein